MFKPDSWQSHDEYRTIVHSFGRRLSRNNPRYHFDLYSVEYQKLFHLNLDPLRDFIAGFFSPIGRPAKNQAQLLRSLILFALLFNKTPARTSLTAWVCQVLPNSISLAVLCSFTSTDHLPPLGSYYDFMNRLWLASRDIYSRTRLLPAGKNGKKPDKVIGTDGKLSEDVIYSEPTRTIVNNILKGKPASDNPEAVLQEIFSILAVLPSVELGYDFGRHTFGLSPVNLCLDSAHDNLPTYELLEHWDINALIDINGRTKSSQNASNDVHF